MNCLSSGRKIIRLDLLNLARSAANSMLISTDPIERRKLEKEVAMYYDLVKQAEEDEEKEEEENEKEREHWIYHDQSYTLLLDQARNAVNSMFLSFDPIERRKLEKEVAMYYKELAKRANDKNQEQKSDLFPIKKNCQNKNTHHSLRRLP
jgi:hypothetical protein